MKKWLVAAAVALVPVFALAQSMGTVNLPTGNGVNTPASVSRAINTALATKADANNGTLLNPTINGTLSGTAINSLLNGYLLSSTAAQTYVPATNGTLTNPTINGGTINGLSSLGIGTTAPSAGSINVSGGYEVNGAALSAANLQFQSAGTGSVSRTISSKLSDIINAADFGTVCTVGHDNTAEINAALAYAGIVTPAEVMLPPGIDGCEVSGTLTVPQGVTLEGNGGRGTVSGTSTGGGLVSTVSSLSPMINLVGSSSGVEDLSINESNITQTAGTTIQMAQGVIGQFVQDVYINGAYVGVDVEGNSPRIDGMYLGDTQYIGFRIGSESTGGNVIDPRITNSTVANVTTALAGQEILDSGGLYESNNDLLGGSYGTYVYPGANQTVQWSTFSHTVLGDTNQVAALYIDTAASSATIEGSIFDAAWTANSQTGNNIDINNSSGSSVETGFQFIGLRDFGSHNNGLVMNGGNELFLYGARFCNDGLNGATASDVVINDSALTVIGVQGSQIGTECDGSTISTANIGLELTAISASATGIIGGNNFSGLTTPISGSVPSNVWISQNAGYNNLSLSGGSFNGDVSINEPANGTSTLQIYGANDTNGANFKLEGNGATTPNKTIRVNDGALQVLNSAYGASILNLTDAGALTVQSTIKTGGFTVSTLPTGIAGARAYVTDATACTLNGTLTGGGSTFCPVIYNGSAWVGG
jgi:hypothetical protein